MDEIIQKCDGLSLLTKEDKRVFLTRKLWALEHVLAAKLFTKRSLSMDVVARTFHPLWRTKE